MKKLLFVLPALGIGGVQKVLVTLANRLVRKGCDVTILTYREPDELKSELDSCVHFKYKKPNEHFGNKIPYIRYKLYDSGMWEKRATPRQFYRYYVGSEKYDAEIAFFHSDALKIVSGSTNKKSVKIAWVHCDFSKNHGTYDNFRSKEEFINAYKKFDNIVCVSKATADAFRQTVTNTDKIRVIHNILPVDEIIKKSKETPKIKINKSAFHIVSVARYSDREKGQLRLIDAAARLRADGEDISLALIGAGKDEKLLRDKIEACGAKSFITLADGGLNPYPYIRESDLLVCSSYYEGYNLTVAEGIILGVPVLSTDCAGPKELLDGGKYGMIVENSADGLYLGLKQLINSPALLDEYRKKAAERKSFFDEDKLLGQFTEMLPD